ncbi:ABC transporter permease subunit [Acanthopleuribacter pedis]|uniref:ABC transporter permease subunit n=1 Tax=Acanthopleuribacter pedis TaxID=442870 RepID=A0A8J7U2I5_9BACT|nr:ABC transporter permease subunit [Acanthopleuribacter pedis]MBO1317325.1 ABC transporter permease subunit [Acanthopleuribacter pedis]MBO1318632.1 ABC transporter permease subunit [Acanthopleuribacter pedis]
MASHEVKDPLNRRYSQRTTLIISAVTTLAMLLIWWAATALGWVKPLFLPSPQTVVQRLGDLIDTGFADATLWQHTLASLFRVFSAFLLAVLTAVPIGILMGIHDFAKGLLDPVIEFYRPLPPLAYLPLIIIWLGIGEVAKVVLIYLAMFAPICLSTRAGVRAVAREKVLAAATLGASRLQIIRHIVLPGALPEILTGMRVGIGFGWTTLVAAEMVAATAGLGFMVLNAKDFLATDVVIAGIFVIGIVAYGFDLIMRGLEHWLVPWKGR